MPKSKKSAKSPKSSVSALAHFQARLKSDEYSQKGARIALTRMTNEGTLSADKAKTAERAYKKAFG